MLFGIDISKHQGAIDFQKVKQCPDVEFVICRSSYRNTVDPRFFEYVKGFQSVGIGIPMVYHFSYATQDMEAYEEALFCIQQVESAGLPKSTIICYDYEYDTVKKAEQKGIVLTPKNCRKFTESFLDAVITKGYRGAVYMNKDYYRNQYGQTWCENIKNMPALIWLADYSGKDPAYQCSIWQTSNSGQIPGIDGNVDLDIVMDASTFKIDEKNEVNKKRTAKEILDLARSWLGKKESDGSYKEIIDTYNSYQGPFPRGVKMQYDWSWCACFWSALAIKLGWTDIIPIEISCGELIKAAQKMGIWVESDGYNPKPGDAVLYDWQDSGKGDNIGWPDHVGIVEEVFPDGSFFVIEGNYDDSVKRRSMKVNGKFIRGFIVPKYDTNEIEDSKNVSDELIVGNDLDSIYYDELLKNAKRRTTSNLNCRSGAGKDFRSVCVIPKGTEVILTGGFNRCDFTIWPLVTFKLNEKVYQGFVSGKFLSND